MFLLCHVSRCVNPNQSKSADVFEDSLVAKQLKYTGIMETVNIRRQGFAFRPTFPNFIHRCRYMCCHTHTRAHAHTHTRMRTHARTHAHAHTHARMRTHACTHTHTHTHTHSSFADGSLSLLPVLAVASWTRCSLAGNDDWKKILLKNGQHFAKKMVKLWTKVL